METVAKVRKPPQAIWRIELLGQLRATHLQEGRVITRFRSQKTGVFLAYLACFPTLPHPRELLIDRLWPEADSAAGRHNLANALSSLRHQFEPPGAEAGSVFLATRFSIQINPVSVITDVEEFACHQRAAEQADTTEKQAHALDCALDVYGGLLCPGYYDEWVLSEQRQLHAQFVRVLQQFAALSLSHAQAAKALEYARRAVRFDALCEESQTLLAQMLAKPSASARPMPPPSSLVVGGEEAQKEPDKGYIPASLTRFFGREREKARLNEMLRSAEARLVTLTGPGGIGKTRLALEVAERARPAFPGGTWFVPLADLTHAHQIYGSIRDALHLPRQANADAQIMEALSQQPALLLLDNFEHLVEGGAEQAQTLLERVPTLSLLVTSRQRLNVVGETLFHVAPLPLSGGSVTPEQVAQSESVRLFVDRARAVRPDFQVTVQNAPAVAELCDRLEGIPLALELAAARAQVLTPAQMLQQVNQRFQFLVSRSRGLQARHRALRTTLDWSYHLLAPELQRFFATLFVFRGGWTWEAAEVIGGESLALDLLAQLHECSLVLAEEKPASAEIRFAMLETIRQYAEEVCSDTETVCNRHFDYFQHLAEQAEGYLDSAEQAHWLERLDSETDNFCAALDWCFLVPERNEQGLMMAGILHPFWYIRGHSPLGRWQLERFLAVTEGCSLARAKGWLGLGVLLWHSGETAKAREALELSLACWQLLGDRQGESETVRYLGNVMFSQGNYEQAGLLYEHYLVLQHEVGNAVGTARALTNLATVANMLKKPDEARARYEEALVLWRENGQKQGLAAALSGLGNVAKAQGDYAQAWKLMQQSLTVRRELKHQPGIAVMLDNLGGVALAQQDYAGAAKLYADSLVMHHEMAASDGAAYALEGLAKVAAARSDGQSTARFLGQAELLRETAHAPLPEAGSQALRALIARLSLLLDDATKQREWQMGREMSLPDIIAHALAT